MNRAEANFAAISNSRETVGKMNTNTALADLDELILLCRDDKARLYIVEAVTCYRSGAYRSAIVATWIAVCYDIIDKLRELARSMHEESTSLRR